MDLDYLDDRSENSDMESPLGTTSVSPNQTMSRKIISPSAKKLKKSSQNILTKSRKNLSPSTISPNMTTGSKAISPEVSKEITFQLNAKTAKNVEKSIRLEMILEKKKQIAKKYGEPVRTISPMNELDEVEEKISRVKSLAYVGSPRKSSHSKRMKSTHKSRN